MSTRTTGDPYVFNVQHWLNTNYGQYVESGRFNLVTENGKTGWATIYALTRAFQIELGIQVTADNFGNGTINAFKTKYPTGIHQQADGDNSEDRVYGIIQGALLCKGYATGVDTPTLHFYNGTGNAIKSLKEDAGIDNSSSTVTLNIMKALLSMDYFYSYDTSERTQKIINMQRYLNANYESYIGLTPCDGIYGRGTSKALIYAIQAEEGMPTSVANGNCGPSTKRCLPNIPYTGGYQKNGQTYGVSYNGQTYSEENINRFKKLLNFALYFNNFGTGEITSNINSEIISNFQEKYSIPSTGTVDYTTWLSLLISCGDTDRDAIACDCATIITSENVEVLTNNNYRYIARYLSGYIASGASKALSTQELKILFDNDIRLFPIHQRSANAASYFTEENAIEDAESAATYANNLHLQFGAIIYFAVDFDATDEQITNLIIPYFAKLYSTFMTNSKGKYRVGVYGTRNLCTRVCNAGYAVSSFVSDMSTGFSGNLGFTIPDNWALDQFATVTISSNGKSIEIDKDGFSGQYIGISQEYSDVNNNAYDESILDNGTTTRLLINMGETSIPVYENKTYVLGEVGATTPNRKLDGDIIGYIKPRDFYLRYALSSQDYDNIHRVMFNDGTDVKIGYIQEQYKFGTFFDPTTNEAVSYQILPNQDVFTCFHYDASTNEYSKVDFGNEQEFIINKPVPYFNTNGDYDGTLQQGDIIKILGNNTISNGFTRPWCNYVDKIKRKGQDSFEDFGKFVSVGIEYASSGVDRAWY